MDPRRSRSALLLRLLLLLTGGLFGSPAVAADARTLAGARGTAAVSPEASPEEYREATSQGVPVVHVERDAAEWAARLARLRSEDASDATARFRYATLVDAVVDLDRHGIWTEGVPRDPGSHPTSHGAHGGELVWRVVLRSPGALSLGVVLEELELPPGATLLARSEDGRHALAPLTAARSGARTLAPIAGDAVLLEYRQPRSVPGGPRLRVRGLLHDYRGLFAHLAGGDASSPAGETERSRVCYVDVNCPVGDPYRTVQRAVVEVLAGGVQCTGALLNNTARDGSPYLLSARHCGDLTNGVFVFGYELEGCGSGATLELGTTTGATLLAESQPYDAQLVLLDETPSKDLAPYYAGWALGSSPQAPAAGIHHAEALPKKIALDVDNPSRNLTFFNATWDTGSVGIGASGSPLFNRGLRVVGAMSGTSSQVCGAQTASYGRLDRFYLAQSLEQWLDPSGTAGNGIGGYDPFPAPRATVFNGSGVNPVIYAADPPALGATWTATVDASARPQALCTLVLGRAQDHPGLLLSSGELLLDLASEPLLRSLAPVVGGQSSHSHPVPADPALAGSTAFTQAAVLGSGAVLTNGLALTVN